MIGPYSQDEEESLDALEAQLMDRQVPFSCMMKMYAEYLRDRIVAGMFDNAVSSEQLNLIVTYLQKAIASFDADNGDALRKPGRLVLWSLHDRSREENPTLAALSRCAVCCFYKEFGWDPDNEESPTPIPFYLLLLKQLDPDMGMGFLAYARTYLLASR